MFAGLEGIFDFKNNFFSGASHTPDNLHLLEDAAFLKVVQWVDDTDAQLVKFQTDVITMINQLYEGRVNGLMTTVRENADVMLASDRQVTSALAEFSGRSQARPPPCNPLTSPRISGSLFHLHNSALLGVHSA